MRGRLKAAMAVKQKIRPPRRFRLTVLTLVSVPLAAAALASGAIALLAGENQSMREYFRNKRWVEQELIARIERGDELSSVGVAPCPVIVSDRGEILYSSAPWARTGERLKSYRRSGPEDDGTPLLMQTVQDPGGAEYRVLQWLGNPSSRERAAAEVVVALPLILVIMLGGSLAFAWVLMDRFQHRLAALQAATRRIAGGDFSSGVGAPADDGAGGGDELALLAADLDAMRSALAEDEERRSRFLMGVSHDLSTPIAAVRGYLDAWKDGLLGSGPAVDRAVLAMQAKLELLEDRIAELIELARIDTGEWKSRYEPIDLAVFLGRLAEELEQDAALSRRRFRSDLSLPDSVRIMGDRTLLSRAFENLCHNALRYTREGDEIRLAATRSPEGVEVRLDDGGPGFGPADPETLFEPFARGSRGRNEGGFGLGLSITRSVLSAHGASISAAEGPSGGASFRVLFPGGLILQ